MMMGQTGCFMAIDGGNSRLKATFFIPGADSPEVMVKGPDET